MLVVALLATPAFAVEPGERLADPALEERARNLSKELRCLVCQNQSIDDSDAGLAKDLRRTVRERIAAGDTDTAVIDHVVDRYGEFVLLRPRWGWHTALLWAVPVVLLLAFAAFLASRRRHGSDPAELSAAESERIEALLADQESARTTR